MRAALLAAAVALTGCAIPLSDSNYDWYHTGLDPVPMEVTVTSQENVQALCCNTGIHVMACAFRDLGKKKCQVFTAYKNLPQSVLEHEQRHCDGWSHQVLAPIQTPKQCMTPDQVF